MSNDNTQGGAEPSPASAGSASEGSLAAYLKWRDAKIAARETDVNPFMVWSAGVRYAIETFHRNDRFSTESAFPASENARIAEKSVGINDFSERERTGRNGVELTGNVPSGKDAEPVFIQSV